MKVNPHKLGLAGAIASAVFSTGCAILMQLFPEKTIEMSASLFHLSSFGPLTPFFEINPSIYVSGLVQSAVYAYIYFYILGYALNRVQSKR